MAECIVNSTYEPSAIVQAIHDIPRFFVDHETDELNAYTSYYEYTQALLFWMLAPLVLGVCIFIALSIYCCCICCCCCARHRDREKSKTVSVGCIVFQTVLFFLSLGIIGASIYMEVKLNESISETIELSDNILDTADMLVTETSGYNSEEVSSAIMELDQALFCSSFNRPDECNDLDTLSYANMEIGQALTSINSPFQSIQETGAVEVFFVQSSEVVNNYETARHWSVISSLCLVAALLLVHCFSVLGSFRCWIIYFLLLLCTVTFFFWDGLGVLLGFTIVLADVCIDPLGAIGNLTGIVDPLTNITSATFYLSCECNPFAQDIDALNSAIGDAEAALAEITEYVSNSLGGPNRETAMEQLDIISNALTIAEASFNTITDLLQCETSNGNTTYLDQALYNFCTDGFGSMAVTFFLLSGLAVILVIVIYSSTLFVGFLCSVRRERNAYNDRDIVPFDNGHASWGNNYSTSYNKPYSATNPYSLTGDGYNYGHTPTLTSGAPPNYLELQVQNPGSLSEEYDRYQA